MSQGKTNPKSQYVEVKDSQQIRKLQALKEKPAIIPDDRQTSKPILKNKSQKATTNQKSKPQEKSRKPQNQNARPNPKKQHRNQNEYSKQKPQQRYEGERIHKQNIRKNYQNYYQRNYQRKIIAPFYKCKDNEIFINDNNNEKYMQKVHQIIGKYDFINLIAYGNNIATAILVSEQASKEIKKLYRINCPGTINAQNVYKGVNNKKEERKVQILQPSLKIQLSLKTLPIRHMGYQDNLEVVNYNRKDRKKGYKAKEQQIGNDKKKQKKYMEKKVQDQDEGEYR